MALAAPSWSGVRALLEEVSIEYYLITEGDGCGKATAWKKFPHADKAFVYAGAALKKNWERLHRGDCEPFPADTAVQEAWRAYQGEFHKAWNPGWRPASTATTRPTRRP